MKKLLSFVVISFFCLAAWGQSSTSSYSFIDYQRGFPRISDALRHKEDTLRKQFAEKKLPWPARNIFLRSIKYDSRLEVWVRYASDDPYQLFKSYKVCALAGTLGPKRMQGDYQVPEGFYYINEFNPRSNFHLSLGLNYPNSSDRILSDSIRPGGDIYIHGKCVTSGCIPIQDSQIEELYILAAHARNQGQDFIPVHIYPIDFNNTRSEAYLEKYVRQFPEYLQLAAELRRAYSYFEKTRKLPLIMTGENGEYIMGSDISHLIPEPVRLPVFKMRRPVRQFREEDLAKVVDRLPVYPGGHEGFQKFLNEVSRDMKSHLNNDQQKTYLMVEFIIDREGSPAYAKVISGGNPELNDLVQERFENMPPWVPARRLEQNVAIRLKQSIEITR